MRCALTLAYNGAHFLGSQSQKESQNTVLGVLQNALKKLHIESKIVASGRTDRGVHATGQVCHIDVPHYWENGLEKLRISLNKSVGPSLVITKIKQVDEAFHARYSAKKRIYRYIIKQGSSNPFEEMFITFLPHVDIASIQEKMALFCGTHDFLFFMKNGSDVKSTVRTIFRAFVYEHKGYIVLVFEANGFLRSQIRLMVGALLSLESQQIQEQLECIKRHKIKPAPCNGLYLSKIIY